jgi:hypothetical protein
MPRVQNHLQNSRNLTAKPQQQVESVREKESDELKDGEASLYTALAIAHNSICPSRDNQGLRDGGDRVSRGKPPLRQFEDGIEEQQISRPRIC